MFVFVSDLFKKDYSGGAELTFDVLMNAIDLPKIQINSVNVSTSFMESNRDKIWIFGNYAQLSDACIVYAIKNLNYYLVEFDYKYCVERLEALCELKSGFCNCPSTSYGKLRAAFTGRSKATFWMSQGQLDVWCERFPPLKNQNNIILSSAFSDDTLSKIQSLDTSGKDDKWIILGSQSWVKGKEESVEYAKKNNLNYDLVWGLPHDKLLEKLARSKGLIQLPNGHDTCPRMVIEAKLLDCELVINHNVQHKDDDWFGGTNDEIIKYLMDRPSFFRDSIYSLEQDQLPTASQVREENVHFSVVIPSFNNQRWLVRTLKSVSSQNYKNYDVYFIDDASTDNSRQIVEEFVSGLDEDVRDKFNLIFNNTNKKALHNIAKAIDLARDDTVVVLLDGDDSLSTHSVLAELAEIYKNKNIWTTTGSYIESGTARVVRSMKLPKEAWVSGIRKFKEPPGHPNIFSHLRTFRKSLYEKINQEDLKENGEYYPCTFDRALMYPLVEMAGPERHCVVEKAMYIYNTENPRSVHHVDRQNQLRIEKEIRNKKPYARIQACL